MKRFFGIIVSVLLLSLLIACDDNGDGAGDTVELEYTAGSGLSREQAREVYSTQTARFIQLQLTQNEKIADAVVVVETDRSSQFSSQTKATTSVQVSLTLSGEDTLSEKELLTITEIVIAAVPEIDPDNISIEIP